MDYIIFVFGIITTFAASDFNFSGYTNLNALTLVTSLTVILFSGESSIVRVGFKGQTSNTDGTLCWNIYKVWSNQYLKLLLQQHFIIFTLLLLY